MLMLHTKKLLLRRLACVPWLLAVGLVLGWSGEAAANDDTDHNDDQPTDHTHATDPYLEVSYKLSTDPNNAAADTVFVKWSTSYSKNFANNDPAATRAGNGAEATQYTVDLFQGEIPADIIAPASVIGGTGTFTGDPGVNTREHTFILDLETAGANTGPGFYWVKMEVEVINGDEASGEVDAFFARQIAVEPDYILSVNPSSIREDADATDITVSVRLKEGKAVDEDDPTLCR